MTTPLMIEAREVNFSYGKNHVLHDVSLAIEPGEVVALLGPNGVGKTTLVENLVGTLSPSSGHLEVFGEAPSSGNSAFLTRIGLVQQHWADHPKWRVMEHLTWIAAAHRSAGRRVRDITETLEAVGVADKATAVLRTLSGGQRRRVDLAAALLAYPPLLILDEPTTGLDPAGKAQIHDLLDSVIDEGVTVFLTTHDLSEAEKLASRIFIMNNGRIIADGAPWQLREELVAPAQVTWRAEGKQHVHATNEVEAFVATLPLSEITHLTITRPTLEDAYLSIIGKDDDAA